MKKARKRASSCQIKNQKGDKMSYFDRIKTGDMVWGFEYGWGVVVDVREKIFVVGFQNDDNIITINYTLDGKAVDQANQTLFWDEVKFKIPAKPRIKLKNDYSEYIDENNFGNINSICQLVKVAKLLSLRDQECPESRGFVPGKDDDKCYIFKDKELEADSWTVAIPGPAEEIDKVYFKTEKDAQKICDILNSGRFEL